MFHNFHVIKTSIETRDDIALGRHSNRLSHRFCLFYKITNSIEPDVQSSQEGTAID